MGELHLDILVDRMKREFKVEANVGAPQVAYRETFRAGAKVEGKFARQSGGRGQFGHVWIEFEPNEEGKGFEFENKIVGGVVPREYVPAVQAGLEDAMQNGVLAGYPLVDVKAALVDGSYHDVDSSEMAFKIAASLALKKYQSLVFGDADFLTYFNEATPLRELGDLNIGSRPMRVLPERLRTLSTNAFHSVISGSGVLSFKWSQRTIYYRTSNQQAV
jgi:hypothetical protein